MPKTQTSIEDRTPQPTPISKGYCPDYQLRYDQVTVHSNDAGTSIYVVVGCPCGDGVVTRAVTVPGGDEQPWGKDHDCDVRPNDLDAGPNRAAFRRLVLDGYVDRFSEGNRVDWLNQNVDQVKAVYLAIVAHYRRKTLRPVGTG